MKRSLILATACIVLASGAAQANERRFTLGYEAREVPAGTLELEQWVTWKHNKRDNDSQYDRLDLREELEYSVTDKWRLALYYDWRYTDGRSVDDDRTQFRDIALESLYVIRNATPEHLGVAIYGEIKDDAGYHEDFRALEGKIILTKDIGDWTVNWNGIIEGEWEGEGLEEQTGVLGQTLGVSYGFGPRFSLGAEAQHELEYADWDHQGEHVVYVGPVASWRFGELWATLTPAVEVTDVEGEPEFMTRMILGASF
ncbi:MAG: hypothetical protein A3K19_31280 [Lentisphaerae bacterium RIFOXYB12_FULL_65_16]|nr:MAG: hypothetical protein A3K18_22640 [Lentisphaerae bacterium RIFOXYA12_64_32]OGV87167.1 MAG: hypothetical protein A3K19_31280 [Lentisphaerae bacterium RIFOXYB12_FULL_65_16]